MTNPKIQVITVASFDALDPYAKQWDQLALQAPQQLPMLSSAWVMAYLQHCLNPAEKWRCYLAATPDGRLIGILPIIIKPHPLWRSFFPTLHTPWDWHTRSGDLLAESGLEDSILQAFLTALRADFGNYFALEITGVKDNSPTLRMLHSNLMPGWASWIKPDAPGSIISIDKTFEEYQKQLSAEFKTNLRKNGRRLARMPNFTLTFLEKSSSVVFPSFEKFLNLEASGWKGKSGTAIIYSSQLKAFYNQLARGLIDRGWLELHFLEVEGKPIAGHFAIRFGSALVIPKIAYDEAYSKYSPGSILFERTAERTFTEASCREINLLADVEWHKRWKAELRGYFQVNLFPKHLVPLVLGKAPKILYDKLKKIQWLRHFYHYVTNLFPL